MPVIRDPADSARWVGEEEDSVKELKALLRSFNPERMECFPVSASVGSVKNNDPRRRARGGVRSCGTHRTGRT